MITLYMISVILKDPSTFKKIIAQGSSSFIVAYSMIYVISLTFLAISSHSMKSGFILWKCISLHHCNIEKAPHEMLKNANIMCTCF